MCSRSVSSCTVVDPSVAVAGDLVAGIDHRLDRLRVPLGGHRNRVYRQRDPPALEQLENAPHADARAIFVKLLHADVADAQERLRGHDLREERLRGLVAVQDAVLAAFLVIEHELHGYPRASRPVGLGRIGAVADEIAGILGHRRVLISMGARKFTRFRAGSPGSTP
jgi:hypothetical protein